MTIVDGSRHQFSANRRSLTISSLEHEDEGQYMVVGVNAAGSDSTDIQLVIEGNVLGQVIC